MLQIDRPAYPAPGCAAVWQERPATLHQFTGDGAALIFTATGARRVDASELSPPPELDAFSAWADARVEATGRACFTSTADLYEDYRQFAAAAGLRDYRIRSQDTFEHFLRAHSYRSARRAAPAGAWSQRRGPANIYGFTIALRPRELTA